MMGFNQPRENPHLSPDYAAKVAALSGGNGKMGAMTKLLANPTVRLALRALVAAAATALTQIHMSGSAVAWHAVAVGAALAFVEVFTPLNSLVGYLKPKVPPPVSVGKP